MILGGDYSLYDQVLDWKRHTWSYAFIKTSEGVVTDSMFNLQWGAARGYVYRGGYHFFRPTVNWLDAAQKFCYLLSEDAGELPAVLDLEVTDGVGNKDIRKRALEWLRYVHRITGKKPIVYTSPNYIKHVQLHLDPEFGDYPSWIATYPYDQIYPGWTEADRAQQILDVIQGKYVFEFFSDLYPWEGEPDWIQWTGKCPPEFVPGYPLGHKDAVDVNFYRNSLEEMILRFRLPPLTKGDDMDDAPTKPITWKGDLKPGQTCNLRSGPGKTYGVIKQVTAPADRVIPFQGTGAKIHNPADGYYWGEVVLPEPGWIAFTTSFGPITWITEPTPPDPTRTLVKSVLHYSDGSTEELFPR